MISNFKTILAIAALAATSLLAGCTKTPVETRSTSNVDVKVDLLFEFDDCRVYRFEDAGAAHYFARCRQGESLSTTYDIPEGRGSRPEEIHTTVGQ